MGGAVAARVEVDASPLAASQWVGGEHWGSTATGTRAATGDRWRLLEVAQTAKEARETADRRRHSTIV